MSVDSANESSTHISQSTYVLSEPKSTCQSAYVKNDESVFYYAYILSIFLMWLDEFISDWIVTLYCDHEITLKPNAYLDPVGQLDYDTYCP